MSPNPFTSPPRGGRLKVFAAPCGPRHACRVLRLSLYASLASLASAGTVIFDDFGDGDIATGGSGTVKPGFQLVNNASGGAGTVSETGGHMIAASEFQDTGGDNSGGVSINSFDVTPAGAPGGSLVVTWTIASLSNYDADTNNRVLLDLTGTPFFRGFPTATSGNSADEDHIGLDIRGDGTVFLRSDAEMNTTINTFSTLSELTDGFTVTATFDANGWSYTFDGITMDSGATVSGNWGDSNTPASFPDTFDNETHVNVTARRATANVDSILVEINPGSGGPALTVRNAPNGTDLEFTWPSQAGKVYDLLTSIDPENDGDPDTWAVVANQEDIAAIPPSNTLTIARPVDGKRFYAIREKDAPPPPPIFEDDFESGGTGWSTSNDGVAGTDWVLGNPTGGINNGPSSAFSPDNCYGTNILTDYGGEADVSLYSPVIAIPAGGATLRYQFWIDTETGPIPDPPDFGTLNILDADNGDALLETLEAEILGFPLAWDQAEYVLPASANGKNVKFQFRFVSDAGGVNSNFGGWYIDDVSVTAAPAP